MKASTTFLKTLETPSALLKELEYQGLLVLESYADWCGPCKATEQLFQQFNSEHLNKIRFVRINSALVPWFRRFHGRSRPVFLLIFCGKLKEVIVGANFPRFSQAIPQLAEADKFQSPEQFQPQEYFRELSSDPQYTKCAKQATAEKEDAEMKLKIAREQGLDCDVDPLKQYDNVVLQFKDKWKHVKMFNDVRLQEQIGDLRVDMSGEDNKAVFTGFYSNYGLQTQDQCVELLKTPLKFLQQSQQRKFDQSYTVAVFDNTQNTLEQLQRFYGEVVCKYPEMYFCFLIKNLTADNQQDLKSQFIYFDQINILEDKVCQKIFHRKIVHGGEEENFDPDFASACFIFNHQDKLVEQHANCFQARQYCFMKFGQGAKNVYESGLIDCRSQQYVGYKGLKLHFFNQAVLDAKTKTKDVYQQSQAIAVFCLNPLSINLQQQLNDIQQQMKNKDTYFLLSFDDVVQQEDYKLIAEKYNLQPFNVVKDLPASGKPTHNPAKTKSYQVEPVKDKTVECPLDLSVNEKLQLLASLDKVELQAQPYLMPCLFFYPQRQEAVEIFSIGQLQVYIDTQKKNLERQKLESKEPLPEDKDQLAQPILQINADDIIIYQRQLPAIQKVNLSRSKFSCFCYVNADANIYRELFQLYSVQQQLPEVLFACVVRNVSSAQEIEEMAQKFNFIKQLNLFQYKKGLHKAMFQKIQFDAAFYLLFSEQSELLQTTEFAFELKNRVLRELNDYKKQRPVVPDLVLENQKVILKGQILNVVQQTKEPAGSKRVVVGVFDEGEKDFLKLFRNYGQMQKKHKTCWFLTVLRNHTESMKKKYDDAAYMNIAADQFQVAERLLLENGARRSHVFYIFQEGQLDCACSDLLRMQELILDYVGTEWENGLKFRNKQLQFINKSQLRAVGQCYVVSFFQNNENLKQLLTAYYQKCQSAFPQVYFVTCIQGVSTPQHVQQLKQQIYYANELNIVEDQDEISKKLLAQPIYNQGDQAEDEDYEETRSACFVFSASNALIEQHANALDCRPYLADQFNFRCWPVSLDDKALDISELDNSLMFGGARIQFLRRGVYKQGQAVAIIYLNPNGKDLDKYLDEQQQFLTAQQQQQNIFMIYMFKGVRSQKQLDELPDQLTILEDKLEMPLPRSEMRADDSRLFISALWCETFYSCKPVLSDQDLQKMIQKFKFAAETDREAEDEQIFAEQLKGIQGEELAFRGCTLGYIQKFTPFPQPPRDEQYLENLEKAEFVLAVFDPRSQLYDEQMFLLQKLISQTPKCHFVLIIKDVKAAPEVEKLRQKFAFGAKLNILGYKKGLLKKFQRYDGKFGQMFFVFKGSQGMLKQKCNFVSELEEYIKQNQQLECFALDQKRQVPEVEKRQDAIQLKGIALRYLQQAGGFDSQLGLVLVPWLDTDKQKLAEFSKLLKEMMKRVPTTYFALIPQTPEQDFKDLNVLENAGNVAERMAKGATAAFWVFKNGNFVQICGDLKAVEDVVGKFIEIQKEADVQEGGDKTEKQKIKRKIKKE